MPRFWPRADMVECTAQVHYWPAAIRAAQTGRTHDRTRLMLQQRQKVLAKVPSTHDPKWTFVDLRQFVSELAT